MYISIMLLSCQRRLRVVRWQNWQMNRKVNEFVFAASGGLMTTRYYMSKSTVKVCSTLMGESPIFYVLSVCIKRINGIFFKKSSDVEHSNDFSFFSANLCDFAAISDSSQPINVLVILTAKNVQIWKFLIGCWISWCNEYFDM